MGRRFTVNIAPVVNGRGRVFLAGEVVPDEWADVAARNPAVAAAEIVDGAGSLGRTAGTVDTSDPYPVKGSIPEVLAWVGDDLGRARHALDAEHARGADARKGIVEALRPLVEG